jgi:dipeptidyl aminopeptidase/acylaminoacyl peptidase
MFPHSTRAVLALCAALLFAAVAAAEPIPVEVLFQKAKYGSPALSPSGRYLAVLTPVNDRRNVVVIDLDTRQAQVTTSFDKTDAFGVEWITDNRIVVTHGELDLESGLWQHVGGRFVMDRDGRNSRPFGGYLRVVPGTEDVLYVRSSSQIVRESSRTGEWTIVADFPSPPGRVRQWVLDFDNLPRAAITSDLRDDQSSWYVRKDAASPWKLVREAKYGALATTPLQFSPDGKTLYVRSNEHGDRTVIVEYDVESGTMGKPILQHRERDVTGFFRSNVGARSLIGFEYEDDRPDTAWFDPEHAAVQKGVDAALPGSVNRVSRGRDGTSHRWLVDSRSDRNPGSAYLFDRKAGRLEKLFDYSPWIKPEAMSPQRWVRYPARDGLTIPALLTVPADAAGKRVPLVVIIHGGPYVPAGHWGYSRQAQFFASRGYAVLMPQFRGTMGFGQKFLSAGYRAWGAAMQDDLVDGVRWAVEQGIADAHRVCYFGGSYGGYAAAWGAIRDKDLIRCSVAYVAVTSIDYMFDLRTTDMATYTRFASDFFGRVGDPKAEADRAMWKRVNPLDHAERVGVPILLAYGRNDYRVPLEHGTDFRAALDKHGKDYEWVVYPDEGHGFNKSENVFDFYRRVERFLAKHLAPKAP